MSSNFGRIVVPSKNLVIIPFGRTMQSYLKADWHWLLPTYLRSTFDANDTLTVVLILPCVLSQSRMPLHCHFPFNSFDSWCAWAFWSFKRDLKYRIAAPAFLTHLTSREIRETHSCNTQLIFPLFAKSVSFCYTLRFHWSLKMGIKEACYPQCHDVLDVQLVWTLRLSFSIAGFWCCPTIPSAVITQFLACAHTHRPPLYLNASNVAPSRVEITPKFTKRCFWVRILVLSSVSFRLHLIDLALTLLDYANVCTSISRNPHNECADANPFGYAEDSWTLRAALPYFSVCFAILMLFLRQRRKSCRWFSHIIYCNYYLYDCYTQ